MKPTARILVPVGIACGGLAAATLAFATADDCLAKASEGAVWTYRSGVIAVVSLVVIHSALFLGTHTFCSHAMFKLHMGHQVSLYGVMSALAGATSYLFKVVDAWFVLPVLLGILLFIAFAVASWGDAHIVPHKCVSDSRTEDIHTHHAQMTSAYKAMVAISVITCLVAIMTFIAMGVCWSDLYQLTPEQRGDCKQ